MGADIRIWRRLVEDQVSWLANEEGQRRAWFGLGPEVDSPTEAIEMFFSNAAVEEFLERPDTEFNQEQLNSLRYLMTLIDNICNETNINLLPPAFIDDPRWKKIIAIAKETKKIMGIITLSDDMVNWGKLIKEQVTNIANGVYLRDVWLGHGDGWDAPFERFNKFFRDAAVEDYIKRVDTGLTEVGLQSLSHLTKIMIGLWRDTYEERKTVPDEKLLQTYLDDPRWKKVEEAAKETQELLDYP